MFKERKNLYFLICCQDILVTFEFAMDFKVDTKIDCNFKRDVQHQQSMHWKCTAWTNAQTMASMVLNVTLHWP